MARAKQPRKKKVTNSNKDARNRALRRAPEEFRLLVDNLNEPRLQLLQAKKLLYRYVRDEGSFTSLAARTLEKVLDQLVSLARMKARSTRALPPLRGLAPCRRLRALMEKMALLEIKRMMRTVLNKGCKVAEREAISSLQSA